MKKVLQILCLSRMNCSAIDLNRVERAVSSLPNVLQHDYHCRKLNSRQYGVYTEDASMMMNSYRFSKTGLDY